MFTATTFLHLPRLLFLFLGFMSFAFIWLMLIFFCDLLLIRCLWHRVWTKAISLNYFHLSLHLLLTLYLCRLRIVCYDQILTILFASVQKVSVDYTQVKLQIHYLGTVSLNDIANMDDVCKFFDFVVFCVFKIFMFFFCCVCVFLLCCFSFLNKFFIAALCE